jgi:aspartate aminotransferase
MKLAARVGQISPSITLVISAKAKSMLAQGFDVVNFTAGEPDFDTPEEIKEAAKIALDQGKTKYGPASGEPRLKEEIVKKCKRDLGLDYSLENVMVTNGGKHSLYNLMLALIEPGDEVIIPSPYWLSYPDMVKMAGGTPVIVPTSAANNYKITSEQLSAVITPASKLFILNSPSNPTGSVYNKQELEALAQVILSHDLHVVSDEIYEKILYEGARHISIASLGDDIFQRSIISNGFAKSYAMTGWRVGYMLAPKELTKAMTTLQSHSTSNVCTFAQYGAIAALESKRDFVSPMLKAFSQRRLLMLEKLKEIPAISAPRPDGAFYVFLDVSSTGLDSLTFCKNLLDNYQVAAIPGGAFGSNNCIRLSYTTDLDSISKGMQRLKEFVNSL